MIEQNWIMRVQELGWTVESLEIEGQWSYVRVRQRQLLLCGCFVDGYLVSVNVWHEGNNFSMGAIWEAWAEVEFTYAWAELRVSTHGINDADQRYLDDAPIYDALADTSYRIGMGDDEPSWLVHSFEKYDASWA